MTGCYSGSPISPVQSIWTTSHYGATSWTTGISFVRETALATGLPPESSRSCSTAKSKTWTYTWPSARG